MLTIDDIKPEQLDDVILRVEELRDLNEPLLPSREKTKDLMDGGPEGLARLTGRRVEDIEDAQIPAVNLMLMANTRLAQKLGPLPDTKVDTPAHVDDQRVHKYAAKRRRYVDTLDSLSKLEIQLPQVGRWLPGYGFAVWTLNATRDPFGQPYADLELRDPFNCYPGEFGTAQQPDDLAFAYIQTPQKLARRFPEHADKILSRDTTGGLEFNSMPRERGGIILKGTDGGGKATWANQSGDGIEVYEYWNEQGTWTIIPDRKLLLNFTPNVLSRPAFVFIPRYSFNKLRGQYDHVVGLMAAIARLNLMSVIQAEKSVFAETNIFGETMDGDYHQGEDAVNHLTQGSKVEKMNERIPFEVFQQIDRLEKQLRQGASYPVTDDGGSPISFVTGQGIAELTASMDLEVREYQTLIRWGLELADQMRLEYIEKVAPGRKIAINGVDKNGGYAETIKPKTHIKGNYVTRRVYGIMAGWDEPNKIAGGMNLLSARIISTKDVQENIAGLEDHDRIRERIREEDATKVLMQGLMAAVQEERDPNAIKLLVEMLPEGDQKQLFQEFYIKPMEEQQAAQQEQMQAQTQAAQMAGGVPDAQTVMAKLTGANPDNPEGSGSIGAQAVGRM